jgi:hypothetical protein
MAFPSKPTVTKVAWTDGDVLKQIEPSSGKKTTGWIWKEKPPFEWMNWLFYSLGLWTTYFDGAVDWLKARKSGEYDILVGAGLDYATLADALVDATPGQSILVCSDQVLNSTILIATNNLYIRFKPGVTFSAGSASTGIELSGSRVFFDYARLNGFSIGIQVNAGSNYSRLNNCFFVSCTTPVVMNSTTSSEQGSLYEA